MRTALTIAGSDSSGGAGIQADIKTMTMHGVFAMSALTALTAQNTMGVQAIMEVTPEFLAQQLDSVFTDIRPNAVKIGMVSSMPLIRVISSKLREYRTKNIVVDPVMVATSGARLIQEDAIEVLGKELFSIADLLTPNIPEAEILAGMEIKTETNMIHAAKRIYEQYHCAVLLKGGHSMENANDLLFLNQEIIWILGRRIENSNTHGTGCTLSSAIASGLAKGQSIEDAVRSAKHYLNGALEANLNLGKGSGPLNHMYGFKEEMGIYEK